MIIDGCNNNNSIDIAKNHMFGHMEESPLVDLFTSYHVISYQTLFFLLHFYQTNLI